MAFQIVIHPSDTTPPPGAFQALANQVLVEQGAVWVDGPEHGELRLQDGTEIIMFMDDQENVAAFSLDDQNEAAFDLIYSLVDQAEGFVILGNRACAFANTGCALPADEHLFNPDEVGTRPKFGDWMRVAMREASPPTPKPSFNQPPPRSLFQKISDALFGKSM